MGRYTEIYPSSFTNVRFWKKIEFSNVIVCQKRSQNCPTMKVGPGHCLSFTVGSWGSPSKA